MSHNQCLICSSEEFSEILHVEQFPVIFGAIPPDKKKDVEQFPITIASCLKCNHVQQVNLIDEDIMNRVYNADYYNLSSPVSTGMGTKEINNFYSFFSSNTLNKGKLLEIACFDGYLLKIFQTEGWDVFGCDPSPITVTAGKLIGEEKINNEFFYKGLYPPNSFDVIIFRNLLEHVYDLHGFLSSISYNLKYGGSIFIDVPNIKEYVKYGGLCSFFHQHISYFSLQTLTLLLTKHGYSVERSYEGNPNLFIQALKGETNSHNQFQTKNETIGIDPKILMEKQTALWMEISKYFNESRNKRIALFGASAMATYIVCFLNTEQLNKIVYIFDNDVDKHQKELFNCKVIISNPENIDKCDFDSLLITTNLFSNEICQQLNQLGIDKNKITSISVLIDNI